MIKLTTIKATTILSILALSGISNATAYRNLPVNDSWGFVWLYDNQAGCEIYEARTRNGSVIIKSPVYRIGKFLFTTNLLDQKCYI